MTDPSIAPRESTPVSALRTTLRRILPASVRRRALHQTVGRLRRRRLLPLSNNFGFDRGQPIDRYYIDRFIKRHREDIRGRVLEVGDRNYTLRWSDAVEESDVLDVPTGNPEATFVDDLAVGDTLPGDTFDCVILTQTLQYIYDMPAAVATLRRILKPGGVALVTVPAIAPLIDHDWNVPVYYSLTRQLCEKMFGDAFPGCPVDVATHGNVLIASEFLYGRASEELSRDLLDFQDDRFPILVTVKVRKPV